MAAVSKFSYALEFASDELKNDKEVVLVVVSKYGHVFKFVSDELKNDKDVVLAAVSNDGAVLEYASDELKNDKEVVLAAVSKFSYALEFASDELKNDKEVVLVVVSKYGHVFKFVSDELKNDKEVVLAAVSNNGDVLKYASDELKNDKEVVLAAVSNNGDVLKYASDELKNDKDVVLAAVSNNGIVLKFASDELKNDKDVVLEAVSNNYIALKYASKKLKKDREFVLLAVTENGLVLKILLTKSIDLSNRNIDDNKAKKLAQGLQYNQSITRMNLSNNNITDKGMYSFIEVLKYERNNKTLKELDITNNPLELSYFSIDELQRIRRNLTIIINPKNKIDLVIYSHVEKLFENYQSITELENYLETIEEQRLKNFLEIGLWKNFEKNKNKYRKIYSNVSDQDFKDIFIRPADQSRTMRLVSNETQNLKDKIDKLKAEYEYIIRILRSLNDIHTNEEIKHEIQKIGNMFPDISPDENDRLEQIFRQNLNDKKDLYFQRQENKQLLRKYKVEQFIDTYTSEPIDKLNINKKDGHFIDQNTKNSPNIKADLYYTKEQILEKLQNASENQVRGLLPILRNFKDFEWTKLLQKKKQVRNYEKNASPVPSKLEEQQKQIQNSLRQIQAIQLKFNNREELLQKKQSLQNKRQQKKTQMEGNQQKRKEFYDYKRLNRHNRQIQKPQIVAQIQELQKRISDIQKLLPNKNSEQI